MRSGKHILQLQNDIKNDYAKGVENSFPATVAAAMQIMNNFKVVIMEASQQVSLGTAFAQRSSKKQSKGRLTDEQWNALSPEEKTKLIKKQKAGKVKKAGDSAKPKKSLNGKDNDDSSIKSTKSMADLEKDIARLKWQLKSMKAALVTMIAEGDESDLLDNKGSSSFNAALIMIAYSYPSLHDGIVLAHTTKALNLQKAIPINGQTMHNIFCNTKYVEKIRRSKKILHLSTNGGGMTISTEADVQGLYSEGQSATDYFDMKAITNILTFKKLAKINRIT